VKLGPLLLGATVLAVMAGCGSPARKAAPVTKAWHSVGATLTGPLQSQSPNSCNRGAPACVAVVVGEMQARLDALAAACDHQSAFALMYLRVTQAVEQATRARPTPGDRAYLAHLDAVFAQLYFRAYDAWARGDRKAVPDAWQLAFAAAERRRVSAIGDLLLGMNAHISRDLPFAVAAVGLGAGSTAESRRRSFEGVNRILEEVAPTMLREESSRFDPTVAHFTLPVLKADTTSLALLLGNWRDAALRDGRRLLEAATPAERAAVARSIERNAVARAVVIAAATSRVPFSAAGRSRDAFCRAQRGP
jgi:Family of unknown function (DUF5995)